MNRLYSTSELLEFMGTHGLPKSRMWIRHNEKMGRLKCPRVPNGRKDRAFTQEQMEDIVKAFSPGGPGRYIYE
jgi:hypothetical protein